MPTPIKKNPRMRFVLDLRGDALLQQCSQLSIFPYLYSIYSQTYLQGTENNLVCEAVEEHPESMI